MKQNKKNIWHIFAENDLFYHLAASLIAIALVASFCVCATKDSITAIDDYNTPQTTIAKPNKPITYTKPPQTTAEPAEDTSATTTEYTSSEPVEDTTEAEQTDNTSEAITTKAPLEETTQQETNIPSILGEGESAYIYGEYHNNGVDLVITKYEKDAINMFVCDIKLSDASLLKTAFAGGRITGRAYTSKIAAQNNAVFAVNGDFCGFRSNGIIIRNGTLYRDKSANYDLLCIDSSGNMFTEVTSTFSGQTLIASGVMQTFCFGPTLVANGAAISDYNTPNLSHSAREPRTAIGQIDNLHYCIVVVDAIRSGSETIGGMNFSQLSDVFVKLNCKVAYNLDGGGSTTLYYNDEVINNPCMNGQREVSDIIYIN